MNKRPFKWHHLLGMHHFWLTVAGAVLVLIVYFLVYTHSHKSVTYQSPVTAPVQVPEQPPVVPQKSTPTLPVLPRVKISSVIVPTIATGTATVTNASPAFFSYAHGTTQVGDKFVIGTADRAGNQYASNEVFMFTDPRFIDRYLTVLLPHHGDVETMTYDQASNKVYFLLTGTGDFELYSLDPSTLYLYEVASSTKLDPGEKPAIVSDGKFVYGITNTSPSSVFKIDILTGSTTVNSIGHISDGHSAAIGMYPNKTELYFGGGMGDQFEKDDASTLDPLGSINLAPCSLTDDMPFEKSDDQGGYVYVGCEIQPYGYRVHTADLSIDRFLLPGSSFGLYVFGDDLYNAAQDGDIDIFPHQDLGILDRFHIASSSLINNHNQDVEPNELFWSDATSHLYFTAWWGIPGLFAVSTTSDPH